MSREDGQSMPDGRSVVDGSAAARTVVQNPVLRGFHPDPSILRVDDDYYIATSTFEWHPGVRIHHSRDLVHWQHRAYALTRPSQLDLRGNPRSGGVWAPCLSFDGKFFWLVFTDVKNWGRGFLDAQNFVCSATSIDGPWSDAVALNGSGFDPSLFHDRDGRKWLVNMVWDHRRPAAGAFGGIVIQEFDPSARALVGRPKRIFAGSRLGITEGPHLYRRGDYYYLMVAEGGTGWDHAVTLARSATIDAGYEIAPQTPLLTSKEDPAWPLQKAGHASLVEARDGRWYVAFLCARPVGPERRCILGRETALQEVAWTSDGWLRTLTGARVPDLTLSVSGPTRPIQAESSRDDFDGASLSGHYQTLRRPADPSWLSLTERPGFLRLRGQESLQSWHGVSLVARRVQSLHCVVETCVEFEPESFQQMAGLVFFYDDDNHHYAHVTHDETLGRCIDVVTSDRGRVSSVLPRPVPLPSGPRVVFRAELHLSRLTFSYSVDGEKYHALTGDLDATILSDEYASSGLAFTGCFAGVCAQDFATRRQSADFDYFEYRELDVRGRVFESRDAAPAQGQASRRVGGSNVSRD